MATSNLIVYKLKQISLEPDKYSKHVKLDENVVKILSNGFIMPLDEEEEE